uniref:Protein kinase domain-containing protein n=1 Tax=Eutreptiella gymnastica TaxID=73025 RepID=A0A7S1J9F6_9EUGL|mmetsp:Transcript_77899/g.137329  ORF Transcript_77899/g.137329 Transcript_77899/m.137329 type:complete len:923 (+) Transcript_77899:62-2830(+)
MGKSKIEKEQLRLLLGCKPKDFESKVQQQLGRGSYGTVYKAKSKHLGVVVALKEIDKKQVKAQQLESQIKREIQIHSSMKHPAIVELYTSFEDSHKVYLVMEYCGTDMQQHLCDQGRLDEGTGALFTWEMVRGLQYIHDQGVLHLDIKPANLMITKKGPKVESIKIGDFGFATKQSSQPDTTGGTPNYMAPELLDGKPPTCAADIWSVGCCLYQFLTGRKPFQNRIHEPHVVTTKGMSWPSMPTYLSPEAQDLLFKLLEPNPELRISLAEVLKHPYITQNVRPNSPLNKSVNPIRACLQERYCRRKDPNDVVPQSESCQLHPETLPGEVRTQSPIASCHPTAATAQPAAPLHTLVRQDSLQQQQQQDQQCHQSEQLDHPQQCRPDEQQSQQAQNVLPLLATETGLPNHQEEPPQRSQHSPHLPEPQLPCFDVSRLGTQTRELPGGIRLSIRGNGELEVATQQLRFGISADGRQLWQDLGDREVRYGLAEIVADEVVSGFYQYAVHLVALIRARTVKVRVNTVKGSACRLMEDGPSPSFHISYYSRGPCRDGAEHEERRQSRKMQERLSIAYQKWSQLLRISIHAKQPPEYVASCCPPEVLQQSSAYEGKKAVLAETLHIRTHLGATDGDTLGDLLSKLIVWWKAHVVRDLDQSASILCWWEHPCALEALEDARALLHEALDVERFPHRPFKPNSPYKVVSSGDSGCLTCLGYDDVSRLQQRQLYPLTVKEKHVERHEHANASNMSHISSVAASSGNSSVTSSLRLNASQDSMAQFPSRDDLHCRAEGPPARHDPSWAVPFAQLSPIPMAQLQSTRPTHTSRPSTHPVRSKQSSQHPRAPTQPQSLTCRLSTQSLPTGEGSIPETRGGGSQSPCPVPPYRVQLAKLRAAWDTDFEGAAWLDVMPGLRQSIHSYMAVHAQQCAQ